jgi:hypothetical protein
LIPLYNVTTKASIPNFPITSRQIEEMKLIILDPVLGELGYGIEELKKTKCRRRLLRHVVGIMADFPVIASP